MSEERKRILQMLADGKITAEEADELLVAMVDGKIKPQSSRNTPQFLRIKVWEEGKDKVNVNIPLSLAKIAMKFIPTEAKEKMSKNNIDLETILSEIQQGTPGGKIVEIDDDGDKVEIYID